MYISHNAPHRKLQHTCALPAIFLIILLSLPLIQLASAENKPTAAFTGKWLVTLYTPDIGSIQTVLTVENKSVNKWTAESRSGALRDAVGWWKSTLALLLSSDYPHGSLVHISNGTITPAGDSLLVEGIFSAPALGKLRLTGVVNPNRRTWNGMLSGMTSGKHYAPIEAVPFASQPPLRNYVQLLDTISATTALHYYRTSELQNKVWQNFRSELHDKFATAQDDVDAIFAFFLTKQILHTSHYGLFREVTKTIPQTTEKSTAKSEPDIVYRKNEQGFGIVTIRSFAGAATTIDSIFELIDRDKPPALIIDLRNNFGGNLSSMAVASHLLNYGVRSGTFLTAKWWKSHDHLPTAAEVDNLPVLTQTNVDTFFAWLKKYDGIRGEVYTSKPVYSGKVAILINGETASACEPLAYLLQKNKRATIIGENSAGAMLSSEKFDIGDGWRLLIPTADYYTAEGNRLEGVGVMPDVRCKPETAMEQAIHVLSN